MTDPEFFETVKQAEDHAKLRRQECLKAADVEQFKVWDSWVNSLGLAALNQRLKKLLD